MRFFLALAAVAVFLLAMLHVVVAKTAIHEIAGYVLFLTSAVLWCGAGIIEAIERLRKAVVTPGSDVQNDTHRYPPQ